MRAFLLADDLSGAADCAVAFTRAGLSAIVSLDGLQPEASVEVVAVDADTRCLGGREAAEAVNRLVHHYARREDLLFFKKIDSTLRGHVGTELAAALTAYRTLRPGTPRAVAVCAPAFPALGRTTVDGMQWLHGTPLHETALWRLHNLTHAADIPNILGEAGLTATKVSLDVIRAGRSQLVSYMNQAAAGTDVLVCDAERESDLQAIAESALQLNCKTLLVGSAGLAHHLPQTFGMVGSTTDHINTPQISGPLLFVIGSRSGNSLQQIATLASSSPTVALSVPATILLAGSDSPAWQSYRHQLEQAIANQRDVVLAPAEGSPFEVAERDKLRLSASLARMTLSISNHAGALIAAGGETARAVLACWSVHALRPLGEAERGVIVSVTEGWHRPLIVVTKAGDFGTADTLLHCSRFLNSTRKT